MQPLLILLQEFVSVVPAGLVRVQLLPTDDTQGMSGAQVLHARVPRGLSVVKQGLSFVKQLHTDVPSAAYVVTPANVEA